MKKQIIAAISTHPVRAAFLLILLFLLGSVMHQAVGQGNTGKRSVAANLSQVARPLTGAITGTLSAPAARPDADANMYLPQAASSSMGGISAAAGSNISGAVQGQLATGSNVPTNSITTLFASNNFGNLGGAVYFDLTVASSPISVTALDINTAETVSFSNFRVYVLPGMTSAGHETNMALWTQVATGSGTGAGVDLPTHVTLSNPFPLNAGTLYGIALVADPAITHHYTNGNGSNQNYSNANVSLVLGSTSNVPFTAPVFSPRVWNGTVYYDVGGGGCTPGTWVTKAPYPLSVYGAANVTDGTYAYVFGGNTIGGAQHAEANRYDPVANSWSPLASMTAGADYLLHGEYGGNGKIYVMGGLTGGTLNRIYTIATNAWSTGAAVPVAVYDYGHAYANGKIYVIGGLVGGSASNTVFAYDVVANTWSPLAPLPQAEFDMACGVIGGRIYVAGGSTGSNQITNLYIYDIAGNSWSAGASMGTGANFPAGTVVGGKLWVIGGGNPFSAPDSFDLTQIYDPATNSWSNGPVLNQARSFADAVTLNGAGTQSALIVGGYNSTLATSLTSVEMNTSTNCGGAGCQFHVLIVYTDTAPPTQLQSEIQAQPNVVAVDLFDAQAGTPTLGQLQQYQIVVPYSNFPFLNADTLGNNLADYVDGGGVVVQYGFSHYGPGQPYGVNGRWVTGNYNPYSYSTNIQFSAFSLGSFNAAHPLMAGVTMLNGDFANVVTPAAGATEVAQNNLGNSLVAYRPVSGGHTTVGVTAYVGSDSTQSGDWGKVIVNAGRWLGGSCGPVPSSAVSRKVHGAFTGDINLPLVAIGGAVGIECRNGAGVYQMVVTFPSPVTVSGVSVTSGTGSATFSGSGTAVITVNLTGVTDAQRLGVTLANVNDGTSTGDVLVPMGVLIGDSAGTGNGSVNAGDVGFVKSVSGQTAGAGNFRADVAINGTINASDVGLVKANSGHSLPP